MAFDPSEHTAQEVNDELEGASPSERRRILEAEQAGKSRKSVLEPHGYEPDAAGTRRDSTGRVLYAWEVTPGEHDDPEPGEVPEDTDVPTEQPASDPADAGVAAGGTATTGDTGPA